MLDRDLDEAVADCDRALQLDPKDLNHYNSRGFARFRQRQYEQAVADYDRSLGGAPVASSFYVRGLAKRALGRVEESDADIARGKQLEPGVVAPREARHSRALGTANVWAAAIDSSAAAWLIRGPSALARGVGRLGLARRILLAAHRLVAVRVAMLDARGERRAAHDDFRQRDDAVSVRVE
ncbi:hypothetical protein [Tahibacter soli]|uniref:Tetratricopeptide repeat protein n=1 Tax=Tahibacter soli TaxID=2983605 RepID=A0A9X3YNI7_9GAMM|nr:hypothetical protein [Tahibacter soli]MDC8014942.1 hypothetical protein [Tahibacter soli]